MREAKCVGIRKSKQTPEAMARLAAHNARRWAKPEEHEKLSRQNRREWAHPDKAAKRAASIKRVWKSPELRQRMRNIRLRDWADPAYRAKMAEGVRSYWAKPESKALFSKRLSDRWKDPKWRPKFLQHVRNMVRSPEFRAFAAEQTRIRWADPLFKARVTAWMLDDAKFSRAIAKRAATRRANNAAAKYKNDQFAKDLWALYPKLVGHGYKLSHSQDRAEELAQTAIEKALAAREQFKVGTNLGAWVHTILRNHYLTEQRKAWRETELDDLQAERQEAHDNPDATAELADVLSIIRDLSDEQRVALMLIAGGMSYDEAAEQLGVPAGTIKSRVARARAEILSRSGGVKSLLPSIGKAHEEALEELERARKTA